MSNRLQDFEAKLKEGLFHFEPLMILYLDHQFVHPLIEEHDGPFHRILINFADKTTATLVVTSRAIDAYWKGKQTKRELSDLKGLVNICLTEDTWSPAREYYFATGHMHPVHTEQFCFTELGEAISQAFGKGKKWSLEMSRSEIGAITLEDDGWSFVTDEEMATRARMASQH